MQSSYARLHTVILLLALLSGVQGFNGFIPPSYAFHNSNLFVSAENTFSNNIFSGPMVIEVVIVDPAISSLDEPLGEPSVTVNGNKIRMLQATDGNWYAYFADVDMAKVADATQPGIENGVDFSLRPGKGLNFGKFCNAASGAGVLGFSTMDTKGFAIPSNATTAPSGNSGTDGTTTFVTCSGGGSSAFTQSAQKEMNVVRENRTLTHSTTDVLAGQLGIRDANYWPFIQLYDFTPTGTAIVKYTKAGSTQNTTLTFDSMIGINLSLDSSLYLQGSPVHVTLTDFQLNIDPTDEDSWTWGSNIRDNVFNKTVFYQLFNQTGLRDADGTAFDITINQITRNVGALGAQNIFGNLTTLMFVDNGMLTFNNNTMNALVDVVRLSDNNDVSMFQDPKVGIGGLRTNTIAHNNLPITLTETAPNSGIFTSTDENNNSILVIQDLAETGTTASISYNSTERIITVGTIDDQKKSCDALDKASESGNGKKKGLEKAKENNNC